jgi:L-ascorbate metabolism protein UlaG (beta-lactamase superfamily)
MEIKYLGQSSFLIKTKTTRLVTDPYDPERVGLKFPKVEADIITVSHQHTDHNYTEGVAVPLTGNQLIIDMPGEFEKMNMRIFGFQSFHDKSKGGERGENILYKIEAEGMSILHCGDLGYIPEDSFLEAIGEVDILMVPVGGFYTIDAEEASQLVKKIEPSIAIPMHYKMEKSRQKQTNPLAPVSEFTKKFGVDTQVPLPKLVVKKEEMEQGMKVVVLEI